MPSVVVVMVRSGKSKKACLVMFWEGEEEGVGDGSSGGRQAFGNPLSSLSLLSVLLFHYPLPFLPPCIPELLNF